MPAGLPPSQTGWQPPPSEYDRGYDPYGAYPLPGMNTAMHGSGMNMNAGGGINMGGALTPYNRHGVGVGYPVRGTELTGLAGVAGASAMTAAQGSMSRPWATDLYEDVSLLSALGPPFSGFAIKRCQGFVRCDMDIAAEVVGWVIGKNGATIKDLKMKTGCNMWVDQRALKLTITGPDARIVEHAAKSVEAYIAAAPIKAGAVEAAVARSIDCPEHLLEILADRNTITKIVKETQAQVVVNRKMCRAIVCGTPHAVSIACSRVHAILAEAGAQYELEHGAPPGASLQNSPRSSTGNNGGVQGELSHPGSPKSADGQFWSLFSGPKPGYAEGATSGHGTGSGSLGGSVHRASAPASMTSPGQQQAFSRASSRSGSPPRPVVPPPVDIADLLGRLNLSKYSPAFEENEIDLDALALMSDADFTEMDVPKGPRLKILNALKGHKPVEVSTVPAAPASAAPSVSASSPASSERSPPL